MLVIIAAIGKNNEIGFNNQLIWHLPKDLKFFKEITLNHQIVMGRKTFESLPRLLPNREHIVISKNKNNFPNEVIVYKSIEEFLHNYDFNQEIFVIGGATIYQALLEYVDQMYLTEIDQTFKEADAFFPNFNKNQWDKKELSREEEQGIQYVHTIYRRK